MNKIIATSIILFASPTFANTPHTYPIVFQTPNAAVEKPTPKVDAPPVPDIPPTAAPIHKNDNPHDLNPHVGSYGTPIHNPDTTINSNPATNNTPPNNVGTPSTMGY